MSVEGICMNWVLLYWTVDRTSYTKPFLKGKENSIIRNRFCTKPKKGLEFVAILETLFRFRMTPFLFSVYPLLNELQINKTCFILKIKINEAHIFFQWRKYRETSFAKRKRFRKMQAICISKLVFWEIFSQQPVIWSAKKSPVIGIFGGRMEMGLLLFISLQ